MKDNEAREWRIYKAPVDCQPVMLPSGLLGSNHAGLVDGPGTVGEWIEVVPKARVDELQASPDGLRRDPPDRRLLMTPEQRVERDDEARVRDFIEAAIDWAGRGMTADSKQDATDAFTHLLTHVDELQASLEARDKVIALGEELVESLYYFFGQSHKPHIPMYLVNSISAFRTARADLDSRGKG